MFIHETKYTEDSFKTLIEKILKGKETTTIDSNGSTEGLGIVWKTLEVILYGFFATRFSISNEFHVLGMNIGGILSNIYGHFSISPKQYFLESLKRLKGIRSWEGTLTSFVILSEKRRYTNPK